MVDISNSGIIDAYIRKYQHERVVTIDKQLLWMLLEYRVLSEDGIDGVLKNYLFILLNGNIILDGNRLSIKAALV